MPHGKLCLPNCLPGYAPSVPGHSERIRAVWSRQENTCRNTWHQLMISQQKNVQSGNLHCFPQKDDHFHLNIDGGGHPSFSQTCLFRKSEKWFLSVFQWVSAVATYPESITFCRVCLGMYLKMKRPFPWKSGEDGDEMNKT